MQEGGDSLELSLKIPRLRFLPALALCLLLVLVIGYLDYLSGTELSLSIVYLLPVTLAVLMSGKALGLLVSAISVIVWLFADIEAGAIFSSPLIPLWNELVRLGYCSLHCYLLGRLMDMVAQMKDISLHDPLTKAANSRFFEEYSSKAIKAAMRESRPVTLAFMDMDNFKALNDRLGHSVGDEALVTLAETVQKGIRPEDLFARFGGDEFVLLLPGPDFSAADEVLARLHSAVTKELSDRGWDVTMSVGAVTFTTLSSSVGPLLSRADELMYKVKKGGKNALLHRAWP